MKYYKLALFVFIIFLSCSKEKETINYNIQANFSYSDDIDHFELIDDSKNVNNSVLNHTCVWISMCDSIIIINSSSNNAYFNLPILSDTSSFKVKLIANNGYKSASIIKNIKLPKTVLERSYGLGTNLNNGHSNNDDYSWYIDQMNTGTFSSINCGPTSVTMAIKWVKQDFNKTPLDARNTYRSTGGWWYTNDIINYLNQYSINNRTINIIQIDSIQNQIDEGNIVILCLDMFYIRNQEKDKWHVDKFYSATQKGWGHFIVIKGYKSVDDQTFYETYDPFSFGLKYTDGSIKGKDRYYRSQDLDSAVLNWWQYAIIVSKGNIKSSLTGVDINSIIHKSGQ